MSSQFLLVQTVFAQAEGGQSDSGDAADADAGGVGDINDGGSYEPDPIRNWITVTPSCNANGNASATISWYFGRYFSGGGGYLSWGIYKDGALVHSSSNFGAGLVYATDAPVYGESLPYSNFAADSTYSFHLGYWEADWQNNGDGGYVIAGWHYSEMIQSFGPYTCPAPDLVAWNTAVWGQGIDSGVVTPGAISFGGGIGNVGNANAGAFNVQVQVGSKGTTNPAYYSTKYRMSSLPSSGQNTAWPGPMTVDGSSFTSGTYYARTCVDVDGEVPESNGNNNCGEWDSFTVQNFNWTTYCTGGSDVTHPWQWWQYTDDTSPRSYRFLRTGDGTCVAPVYTWTTYCTGGNDTLHPWQWWQYTDDTAPRSYQYLRAGDGVCTPPAPTSMTATCNSGTSVTLSWPAVAGATKYYPRIAPYSQAACSSGPGWNWIADNGGTCYSDAWMPSYGTSLTLNITTGQTYSAWVHAGDPIRSNADGSWATAGAGSFTCTDQTSHDPQGYLDIADCSLIQGWVYDPDNSSASIDVHIYEGSTFVTSGTANVLRSDVNASLGITGNHGFSIATPSSLKNGAPHTLIAYGINVGEGGNKQLVNTQTITCGAPDLTVSGITPTSAIAGTATTFSATVTNTGSGSTGIGFKNFYQVRSGSVAYEPHTIFAKLFNIAHAAETITDLAYTTMSALTAGGNGVATQTYTFPAAGTYGVRVCADKADRNGTNGNPNGEIAESNENNNCGGWTDVNVTVACTPGTSCNVSNACGFATGTYTSSCTCSASVPPVPSNFGNACASVPATNVCGMPGTGTILCNGSCSAVTPSDTQCLPTVTLSANPTRVRKDTSTKLTWTSVAATSCTLTGQNGFSSTALSGTGVDSTPLDAQTTFTLVCTNAYGSKSASVIVNLLPSYIEQ